MWVDRKKYKELIDENERLRELKDDFKVSLNCLSEDNRELTNENRSLRKELEQLKVKYADEVKKNFELANYLSENKSD
jgi:hypothetical protein